MNAIKLYRVGNWAYRRRIPIVPKLMYYLTFLIYNSSIKPQAEIGEGTVCAHIGMGVLVAARARIGRNCQIGQGCTIGGRGSTTPDVDGPREGAPTIDDDVYIGPGARVLGPIHVGRGAVIGANAVVIKDVPPYAVMGGVPARVLKYRDEKIPFMSQ